MSTNRLDFIEIKVESDDKEKSEMARVKAEIAEKNNQLTELGIQEMTHDLEGNTAKQKSCQEAMTACKTEITALEKSFERFKHFQEPFEPIKLPISSKKLSDEKGSLPYADVPLKDHKRITDILIIARGDTRPIEKISDIGGFHPQATAENAKPKSQEDILSPSSHSKTALGSGLVSFTADMRIAKGFSRRELPATEAFGTVYLAKVTGAFYAINPTPEDEYSVPGGIDKENIVAHRKVNQKYEFEGSIYIQKEFAQEHPELISQIMSQLSDPGDKPQHSPSDYPGKMFAKMADKGSDKAPPRLDTSPKKPTLGSPGSDE